jgi:hypothetical protein
MRAFSQSSWCLDPCVSLQSVYKTYIDVVHIQKDEASNLFSTFLAEETQTQPGVDEPFSQEAGQRSLTEAAGTQVRTLGSSLGSAHFPYPYAPTDTVILRLQQPV